MATWVVGDIHGWWPGLEALLPRLELDPAKDRLWLVGDLVNRGPDSLSVLRWARRMSLDWGDRFIVVLGNHELHLLAAARGLREAKPDLRPILQASDSGELLEWLRHRPLLHKAKVPRPEVEKVALVHAGLRPEWSMKKAASLARQLEEQLRADGDAARHLLDGPREPHGKSRDAKMHEALAGFVNLRTCTVDGRDCQHKGPPHEAPSGCLPWWRVPGARWRRKADLVIFGHWAALGLHRESGVQCMDSGAAWGGPLTALRLEDEKVVQQAREG